MKLNNKKINNNNNNYNNNNTIKTSCWWVLQVHHSEFFRLLSGRQKHKYCYDTHAQPHSHTLLRLLAEYMNRQEDS